MNRTRWMVVALGVGVAGLAAFHPLGGEGSAAAEASSGTSRRLIALGHSRFGVQAMLLGSTRFLPVR